MSDFAYYYIEHKDGKILNFYKTDTPTLPKVEAGSKIIRATSNEFKLLKYVKGDINLGRQILEGIVAGSTEFLKAVDGDVEWAGQILDDYEEMLTIDSENN
jgi:hypothetical protein